MSEGKAIRAPLRPVLLAGMLLLGSGIARAETASVEATCGSVAIGGTALGNTIKINGAIVCGIPPEKLQELIDGGVTHIYVHAGNQDQRGAIEFYRDQVLPKVRGERSRSV